MVWKLKQLIHGGFFCCFFLSIYLMISKLCRSLVFMCFGLALTVMHGKMGSAWDAINFHWLLTVLHALLFSSDRSRLGCDKPGLMGHLDPIMPRIILGLQTSELQSWLPFQFLFAYWSQIVISLKYWTTAERTVMNLIPNSSTSHKL